MKPSEILLSAKKDIPFYILSDYIDTLIADGDFRLAGSEESMLNSAISFFAAEGNPNKIVSEEVTHSDTDSTSEIDFPSEFSKVIQIRDNGLQNVPYEIDTDNDKIVVTTGPQYYGPYEIRYRYKLEDYFAYSINVSGVVTVDTDKDIGDVNIEKLIKNLLKAKLKSYNEEIKKVSSSVQMDLPISETQGETALIEDEIRGQVRIQPSLFI